MCQRVRWMCVVLSVRQERLTITGLKELSGKRCVDIEIVSI